MSKERRHVEVAFTILDCEDLPTRDGETMYADDVEIEVRDVVEAALASWYQQRGHQLLASPPLVS